MTRITFAKEGVRSSFGVFLEPESLWWETPEVPFIWAFDHNNISNVLGAVDEIRREENGEITGRLRLNDTEKAQNFDRVKDDIFYTFFATGLEETRDPHGWRVATKVRLCYVSTSIVDPFGGKQFSPNPYLDLGKDID